ncbi:MAG: hypothetical protein II084_06040, partial [Clostridia bacterium]|nr:hypothetical protein [Clostridia bacterium]
AAFLLVGTQLVYYDIFKEYLTLFSLSNAGEVLGEFWKDALLGIWHALPTVPGDHGTVIGGSISFIGKKRGQRFLNAYDFWMDYLDKLPD